MEEESRKRAGNTRRRHEPRPTMEKERWMVGRWLEREREKWRRDARRREREGGTKRGPNVVVTGDVALPDDISPRNYLSVQRDSARRLPVLMLADNVPIVS